MKIEKRLILQKSSQNGLKFINIFQFKKWNENVQPRKFVIKDATKEREVAA